MVIAWEGWIRYPDGRVGHSAKHQGSFDFQPEEGEPHLQAVQRAAEPAKQTIAEAKTEWDREPEVPGASLYFCITYEAA